MATVLANSSFTFQVLFVDEDNLPMDVDNPTITVFSFSDAGVKQTLVAATAMTPVVPAETGRYTYTYTVPSAFTEGAMLYGEMTGEHPITGDILRHEESVSVVVEPPGTHGLVANFIRGG